MHRNFTGNYSHNRLIVSKQKYRNFSSLMWRLAAFLCFILLHIKYLWVFDCWSDKKSIKIKKIACKLSETAIIVLGLHRNTCDNDIIVISRQSVKLYIYLYVCESRPEKTHNVAESRVLADTDPSILNFTGGIFWFWCWYQDEPLNIMLMISTISSTCNWSYASKCVLNLAKWTKHLKKVNNYVKETVTLI